MKINVESNKWNRPDNKIKSTNHYRGHKKNEKEIEAKLSLCDKYAKQNDTPKLKKVLAELIILGEKIKSENLQEEEISQHLKREYKKYKKYLNI